MIKIKEYIQILDTYDIQKGIIEINCMIMEIVRYALYHQQDKIEKMAGQFTTAFATLLQQSHLEEDDFNEILHGAAENIVQIAAIFEKRSLEEALDMYAHDLGLNSESDTNYTVMARCIATFGLYIRLGVEFDFE